MALFRTTFLLLSFLLATPSWAQDAPPVSTEDEAKLTQMLEEGVRLATSGKHKEAIEIYDKIAANYEDKYRDSKSAIFCARWQTELLMYLLEAANDKKEAKVLASTWAYAYYLKAFSLIAIEQITEAKALLERAIALSPRNSQFHSELGNIYQREKNWPMALQTFKTAESAALEFSPPNAKDAELSRSWRGMAYVLVEQNQLDEAEKLYRQCLELDKNDKRAMNELQYIQSVKVRRSGQ